MREQQRGKRGGQWRPFRRKGQRARILGTMDAWEGRSLNEEDVNGSEGTRGGGRPTKETAMDAVWGGDVDSTKRTSSKRKGMSGLADEPDIRGRRSRGDGWKGRGSRRAQGVEPKK